MLSIKVGEMMRERMTRARSPVEFTAENEHRISELLCVEPPPVGSPEKMIFWISSEIRGVFVDGQTVDTGSHDRAMHLLGRPAVFHKQISQVIE